MAGEIDRLLRTALELGASDLHLSVPSPPIVRINGRLRPLPDYPPLHPEQVEGFLRSIACEADRQTFYRDKELDFSYSVPGLARFRVNASFQQRTVSLSLRPVPLTAPTLEQLGLPEVCKKLPTRPRGLVLVTGPTGSGKSTTIAGMINYLNDTASRRIITIEDPIEFFHRNKKCMVVQREVGQDTNSFATGLRQALRQDPDVIMIGELRDQETISVALTAAETGHLVLGTVHTNGAVQAIERLIDVYPPIGQQQVRYQLSMVLEGVIFQLLLPRAGKQGRVAAVEVLLGTVSMRNQIRQNELHQMKSYMEIGRGQGMLTIEQSLAALVRRGEISADDARSAVSDPDGLKSLV
jgi:twitching motility protein PilT